MTGRSRPEEAGFTLVELLVALILVAFMATLVFGGLRLAVRVWAKTHESIADAADIWAVENVLRRTIAEAYPAFASSRPSDRTIAFEGGADKLSLLAPLPRAIAPGITARMRFFSCPKAHRTRCSWRGGWISRQRKRVPC
jgi:general secretion pathway protein J